MSFRDSMIAMGPPGHPVAPPLEAIGASLDAHRPALVGRIGRCVDRRLRGRLDAEDVVQDALVEAWRRLPAYLARPTMPLDRWLAFLTRQRLNQLRRRHLGAARRDARRDVPLHHGAATAAAAAAGPTDRPRLSPWRAAARTETRRRVRDALDALGPRDREAVVLRHLEERSNGEVARRLGIEASAASKRCRRALERLRSALAPVAAVI